MCDYCWWINEVLVKINAEKKIREKKKKSVSYPVIIVHGDAREIPGQSWKFQLDEVKNAAVAAYRDLIKGSCSIDAIERAICHLESKRYLNGAYGDLSDAKEAIVMDAAIMTDDFCAGCVGAVRNIKHPITLAKKMLQQTRHSLIVEGGTQKLALESGVSAASTPSQWSFAEKEEDRKEEEVDKFVEKGTPGTNGESQKFVEIIGAVAYDRKKRLASGTSCCGSSTSATGTVIGCGIYADERISVSVSGCDKAMYVYAPARKIAQELQRGPTNNQTIAAMLKDFEEETGTCGVGAVAITANGTPLISFACAHFPWAYCYGGCVYYGCAKNEEFCEKIDIGCTCDDSV